MLRNNRQLTQNTPSVSFGNFGLSSSNDLSSDNIQSSILRRRNIRSTVASNTRNRVVRRTPTPTPPSYLPVREQLQIRWSTCHSLEEAIMSLRPADATNFIAVMALCNVGSLLIHCSSVSWWFLHYQKGEDLIGLIGGGHFVRALISTIVFGPGGTLSVGSHLIWIWLMAQVMIGGFKLFFRFHTKHMCMRLALSSANDNIEEVDNILHSVPFRVHLRIGRIAQVLAFFGYILYFLFGTHDAKIIAGENIDNETLSSIVLLDVCCGNMVISLFRSLVAIYQLHYHAVVDMEVRNNAPPKKSGLNKKEISKILKEVEFSITSCESPEDSICSICLSSFNEGEMLGVLPCDDRHRFHKKCIITWLAKKESCPLCQHDLGEFFVMH